jgi:hypothetical protein
MAVPACADAFAYDGDHRRSRSRDNVERTMPDARKPTIVNPKYPERVCWGCDKLCPADSLACGKASFSVGMGMALNRLFVRFEIAG